MAAHKTTRSNPSTQPNHSPIELAPVKAHVYQTIAELNAGLEKAIQNLQVLQNIHLFRTAGFTAMNHMLRGIRARVNRHLMSAINERETANASHYPDLGV